MNSKAGAEVIHAPAGDGLAATAEPDRQASRPAAAEATVDGHERSRFWRDSLRRRMLGVADVAAVAIGCAALAPATGTALWGLAIMPVWIVLAKLFGLYDRDQMVIRHQTFDEVPRIAGWVAVGTAALGAIPYLAPVARLTVGNAVTIWFVTAVLATAFRAGARWLWRRVTPPERTCVIGDGELAESARRKIELFKDMHLELVDGHSWRAQAAANGDARAVVAGVDRIIVASQHVDATWIGELAGVCRERRVKLSVISPLRGRAGAMPRLSEVADLPVLEYDTRDVSQITMLLKRAFDVVTSAAALIITAPLFPVIALAIRLDSPGPVFFIQARAGMRGRPFRMYKFRTMRKGADSMLHELVELDDLREPAFKFRRDPRVTPVGRVLRRLSIDELPQLLNVLRGDMSIVGPRPEQIDLVQRYRPEHRFRLAVKPGVTGPMQVFGRGALSFSERLAVELDYVENLSLSRDLKILFQTLPAILSGNGAY